MDQNILTREGTITNLFFPILIILPLTFLIIFKYFKTFSKHPPIPPGPYSWPIIGNIFQIGNKPHITLTQLAQTYGSLLSVRLGTQLVVVGSSREAAIEILKVQDRILSGRYIPHVAPAKSLEVNNLSMGWVLECNNSWKALRTVCRTELFSGRALEAQAVIREKKVSEMVAVVGRMQLGNLVHIRDTAFATVFNMMSNVLVSTDLLSLEHEVVKGEIHEIVRNIMEVGGSSNISDLFPILSGFDLQGLRKKSNELVGRFNRIWEPIIKERRSHKEIASTASKQDFLDTLINNGSSDAQINMLFLELFGAGGDTSTSATEWTMAELIKNPEYMKKVKEELEREIGSEAIKESHLPRLKFLQACVKETLRLHPPAPFLLPHRATESCEVMNYIIPKNTQVLVNYWAIGRDPEVWEDPLVYKPERFLSSNLDFKGNDFDFIPFGAGRRICPGLPMAAKHVPLLLAALIHYFDWSLPYGKNPQELDMNEKNTLTLIKEQPLLLIPRAKI